MPLGDCISAARKVLRLNEAMQHTQTPGTETEMIALSFSLPLYYQEAEVWQLSARPTAASVATYIIPYLQGREFHGAIFKPPRWV